MESNSGAISNADPDPNRGMDEERAIQSRTPPTMDPIRILGVCGAIGSGKSYACSLLVSQLNCTHHIDADALAHGVYAVGSQALKEIQHEFGVEVIHPADGTVNRKALGKIVFRDRSAMEVS